MPHQCVKCGKIYENTAQEILKGCSSCGSHFFFFFKEEDLKLRQEAEQLTRQEREEMVKDIEEVVGPQAGAENGPIILDLESVRVKKPGKFEIDLVSLFKRKPVIYKVSEGKYIIDIASTFQMMNAEKNKEDR